MNIFEIAEKTKGAKRKGKEFEYRDTGAMFTFRALQIDELADLFTPDSVQMLQEMADAVDNAAKIRQLATQVRKLLAMDVLIEFRNVTQGIYELIVDREIFPEEEKGELVTFDPADENQRKAMREVMQNHWGQNSEFAMFVANSVFEVTNEHNARLHEKKQIS